jgi:hypothetical protein
MQECNTEIDLNEVEGDSIYWTDVAEWWAFVKTVMSLWFPRSFRKFLSKCETRGFARSITLYGIG